MTAGGVKFQEVITESGERDRVTVEALEVWTMAGQSIIPPGYNFKGFSLPRWAMERVQPDELPLVILMEWRETSGSATGRRARADFIREILKLTRSKNPVFWMGLKCWWRVFLVIAGIISKSFQSRQKSNLY